MNETLLFTVLVLCILGVLSAVILYFVAQKFKVVEDPRIGVVEGMLPGANCGGCGFAGCRGMADALIVCCDGLKGLPEAVEATWPKAIVQTCVVHLLRNTFRYASKKDWDAIKRDVKPIYTAPSAAAAAAARDAMLDKWEARYPAIRRLWMDAWERFIPFLDYDVEIRRVICTTNAIESLNARFKRSIRARGHFPDEQAALKCMYLTVRSLDPTGKGRIRWSARWKPALNAFAITFADRWPSEGTQQ